MEVDFSLGSPFTFLGQDTPRDAPNIAAVGTIVIALVMALFQAEIRTDRERMCYASVTGEKGIRLLIVSIKKLQITFSFDFTGKVNN